MKKTLLLLFAVLTVGTAKADDETVALSISNLTEGWGGATVNTTTGEISIDNAHAAAGWWTSIDKSTYKYFVVNLSGIVKSGYFQVMLNDSESVSLSDGSYIKVIDLSTLTNDVNRVMFQGGAGTSLTVVEAYFATEDYINDNNIEDKIIYDDIKELSIAAATNVWNDASYTSYNTTTGECEILIENGAQGWWLGSSTNDVYKKLVLELHDVTVSGYFQINIAGSLSSGSYIKVIDLPESYNQIMLQGGAGTKFTIARAYLAKEDYVTDNGIEDKILGISITFPEDKTLISYSPSTDVQLDLTGVDGLTAYTVSEVNATSVKLTETKGIYGANLGYILEGTAGATYNIPVVDDAPNSGGNNLSGTGDGAETVSANSVYVLSDGKFCLFTGTEIPAHKAYLPASYVPTEGHELTLVFGDDDATAIKNIKVGTEDNIYYDLQGRRVLYPTKGLYIVNGKKVIVK